MKLKSILKTLSREQLEHIQSHWEIAPAEIPGDATETEAVDALIANLYQKLQTRNSWETATRNLSKEEWNLINFLAIHGGDVDMQEVKERFFEGDQARMEELVNGLAELGIAYFDDVPGISRNLTLIGIPEPFLRFIDLPSYWEGYLGHFLKELSNNDLKHIATQGLKLNLDSANKNYLIHEIRSTLLNPKFLRRYIEGMNESQQSVFQSLVERNGVCVYRDLLELNVQQSYDHSRGDSLQWLLHTGGVVFTAVPGGNKYNNLLMIPRDIMYIIKNHYQPDTRTFAELDSVTVVEKEQKPSVILNNSNTLLRDIVVLVNYINTHHVRVLANGGIGKNDLKKIIPQLSRYKSVKYIDFLVLFLIKRKFIRSTGEVYRASTEFLTWLEDSQQAYQDLLSWWLKTTTWNEEHVEGNTVHNEMPPIGLVSIVGFRQVVLEVLAEMPQDRWLNIEGFYDEVLPKIGQEIPRRGDNMKYDKHTRSNQLVCESIIAEILRWLGIISVGLKEEKEIENIGTRLGDGKTIKARGGSRGRPRKQKETTFTFRFTDFGRFIMSRPLNKWHEIFEKEHKNEVTPINFDVEMFIVQPTHEIIVPPDLKLPIFYRLNEICKVKSIDVMSLMTIDKSSIRQGLDNGKSGQEIMEFLTNCSRTPIPDSLRLLVEECAEKHGQVNMGFAGGYVVVDDEMVLNQMKSTRKISNYIKTIIDDKVVLLNVDTDVKKLGREMQKIGFMPHLESEHVFIDEDKFTVSLDKDDMTRIVAAIKYILTITDEKGKEVAHDRMGPLLERLKSDAKTFAVLEDLAEPLVRTWLNTSQSVLESKVKEVKSSYEGQINHLVTNSTARSGPSKFNFSGPNPANNREDIIAMIDFAIENEFEMEIEYIKANQDEVAELITPESLERDRLYAHVRSRDSYSAYRLDRIQKSKLV